jgi:hypothetical protein
VIKIIIECVNFESRFPQFHSLRPFLIISHHLQELLVLAHIHRIHNAVQVHVLNPCRKEDLIAEDGLQRLHLLAQLLTRQLLFLEALEVRDGEIKDLLVGGHDFLPGHIFAGVLFLFDIQDLVDLGQVLLSLIKHVKLTHSLSVYEVVLQRACELRLCDAVVSEQDLHDLCVAMLQLLA